MLTLETRTRERGGLGKLRRGGQIPAVYYGPGKASKMIAVNMIQFEKIFHEAGESAVISLKTEEGALDVLIHDVENDPVTGTPVHVDFYLVSKDRKIQVKVPLEFTGVAPAERVGGAVVKVMHEITIEALPSELPQHIVIDLALLIDLHSHIAIKDLILPKGVKIIGNESDMIVGVTAQHEEKEEVLPAADLSAIEVEKKGKKEEEGGAAGDTPDPAKP